LISVEDLDQILDLDLKKNLGLDQSRNTNVKRIDLDSGAR